MWNLKTIRDKHKIIAVIPAFESEKTLEPTIQDIPEDWIDEVVMVDNASQDKTVQKALELGIKPIIHAKNMGYGGSQKTGYTEAIRRGADVVIMIHSDHQYNPALVPEMVLPILRGEADAVFGSRMLWRGGAKIGGMPWWKRIANVVLTVIANAVLCLGLSEYHSGFRAYSRKVLEAVPFRENSNDYVFDTEIIIQLKIYNFRIREIPIPTRYFKDAQSPGFFTSAKYGLGILRALIEYLLVQAHLKASIKFTKPTSVSVT